MDFIVNSKINNIYIQKVDFFVIFDFISNSLYNNLKNKYKCHIAKTLKNIILEQNDLIIIYGQFAWEYINYITYKPINIHIICINTEPIYLGKIYGLDNFKNILSCTSNQLIILDYCYRNIDFINNSLSIDNDKIKIYYLPWTYNNYISQFIKLDNHKDIDILFLGHVPPNSRRDIILKNLHNKNNQLKLNLNIESQHNMGKDIYYTYYQLNRAKIIINIFQYEENRIFDFYRFNILLSNKFFFISEDFFIDENSMFCNYNEYIITSKYEQLVDTIFDYILNNSDNDKNIITNKAFNWYKNILNYDYEILKIINNI